jgi:hypothetical protein
MVTARADKIRIIKKFLSGSNVDELLKVMSPVDPLTPIWFEIHHEGQSNIFFVNGKQCSAQEYEQALSRERANGSLIFTEQKTYSGDSVH